MIQIDTATFARACAFAADAHKNQCRSNGDPYIGHCLRVAALIASIPEADVEMLSAAVLHDTVEDTEISLYDIELTFGTRIKKMVDTLTDRKPAHMNREDRHARYLKNLTEAGYDVQTIKMADICDNTADIANSKDPTWRLMYAGEQLVRISALDKADKGLTILASRQISEFLLTKANSSGDPSAKKSIHETDD